MACGLPRSGRKPIAISAIQGVTYAIITPSSIFASSRITSKRDALAIWDLCSGVLPTSWLHFGLVLGGVFTDTVGWQPAFYLATAASGALLMVGIWALPRDIRSKTGPGICKRLFDEIAYVGVFLASIGLASLSYVLA